MTPPATIDPTPRLLEAIEVAALLRIARPTVYKLSAEGALPAPLRFGRSCRWRAAEIEALLKQPASRRIAATA